MESEEFLASLKPGEKWLAEGVVRSRKEGAWSVIRISDNDSQWEATFMGRTLPVLFRSKELALIALLELSVCHD
ncbi:hypothetical protein PMJ69_004483 [Escherichia coli]|uniref:hypothetical protein n=1 Tax=Escherichia coli TaxID=562 RepID=UPI00038F8EAD|nr:hypothetical protein [Escherichia coli]EFA7625636.1 hypothetical protein [Escherichia coli]EFB6348204.1 hypothetical protein [Escherichia coli]EFH3973323.1 hypothetical protein [Escherichia coli]EFH8812728.1 hypothetical protein [Escherichia coli]EFN9397494.1 hypothetical protein [Escherichia coli]